MTGALVPYNDGLYAVTCFSSAPLWSEYEAPFKKTIGSFTLKQKL